MKKIARRFVSLSIACALMLCVWIPAHASVTFRPSGYDGGGFINVIAVDPFGSGLVLAGADAGGMQRSTDAGANWSPSNLGLPSKPDLVIASIVFSSQTPGKVYMGAGRSSVPPEGGLYVSTDGGLSWVKKGGAQSPKFSGGNNKSAPSLPAPHPRSTGNLIALDETPGDARIYAGSFQDGVLRSADDGDTWESVGLAGKYIRSIAIHPSDVDTLYVSVYGEGVYVTTNAKAQNPSWSLVPGTTGSYTPERIEELKFVGTRLYAVGTNNDGSEGTVYKLNGSAWEVLLSTPCSQINPNRCFKTVYKAIDGYESTQDVLYVGSVFEPTRYSTSPEMYESVLKSTDGGATWVPVTVDPAKIHYELGGPSGPTWWLSQSEPLTMLGAKRSKVSSIAIDPTDPDVIYASGVQGVWKSANGGGDWYPFSRNLNVTFNRAVAADPKSPGKVYATDADWAFVVSSDGLEHVFENKPTVDNGLAIALDSATNPSTVYVSVANQQENTLGEIYSNPNPTLLSNNWTSEGLQAATGGKRPLAIAVKRRSGAPVILAAVEEGGIWKKEAGTWTQVASPDDVMGPQDTKTASLSWVKGTNLVYLYDRQTGVWRSNNSGDTWTLIWEKTSIPSLGYAEDMRGFVAADPNVPTRVYVSAYDGLYRLDSANVGTVEGGQITPVMLPVTNPGPVSVTDDGELYVSTLADASHPARLYHSTDQGATFTDLSDAYYQANAGFPLDLSVGPDGYIYVATFGQGIVVGKPE